MLSTARSFSGKAVCVFEVVKTTDFVVVVETTDFVVVVKTIDCVVVAVVVVLLSAVVNFVGVAVASVVVVGIMVVEEDGVAKCTDKPMTIPIIKINKRPKSITHFFRVNFRTSVASRVEKAVENCISLREVFS